MSITMTDLALTQLVQQAQLYDLTHMIGRKRSSERVEKFYYTLHKLLPITICLEVGAHEASFSKNIKELLPKALVRAYEANPIVYAHFLLKEFGDKNIEYQHMAISNVDGTTKLYLTDTIDGKEERLDSRRQSLLKRIDSNTQDNFVWVPVRKLDTMCRNDNDDSLYSLWIDAEGATGSILEGALTVLEKTAVVYVEMESIPKFTNQWNDHKVMEFLLENDFVPLLRDFQFMHQYNVIFIKKKFLSQVEQEWHKYFGAVQRKELEQYFNITGDSGEHIPVAPDPLEKITYKSVAEIKEAMQKLPLLRAPKDGLDPEKTVVVCYDFHLDEAVKYYQEKLEKMPEFYVVGDFSMCSCANLKELNIKCFSEISCSENIQLYFTPSLRPSESKFSGLDRAVRIAGFSTYFIEKYCADKFYRRNRKEILSDEQWQTVLDFTNILADAESQYSYMAVIHSLVNAEPGYNPIAGYPQYFHPKVSVEPGEILCEGGIDNGVSTIFFIEKMQKNGKIYAFEAFEENWPIIKNTFKDYSSNISLEEKALWSENGTIKFNGASHSSACQSEDGTLEIPCVSIDSYFSEGEKPTCIKLDVEGAEMKVLEGAKKTITENIPKLLLSIYHTRQNQDYVTIPQMLLSMNLDYEYYIGHHRPWYYETILYAKKK